MRRASDLDLRNGNLRKKMSQFSSFVLFTFADCTVAGRVPGSQGHFFSVKWLISRMARGQMSKACDDSLSRDRASTFWQLFLEGKHIRYFLSVRDETYFIVMKHRMCNRKLKTKLYPNEGQISHFKVRQKLKANRCISTRTTTVEDTAPTICSKLHLAVELPESIPFHSLLIGLDTSVAIQFFFANWTWLIGNILTIIKAFQRVFCRRKV